MLTSALGASIAHSIATAGTSSGRTGMTLEDGQQGSMGV
jgi:hypothetical protein